MGLGYGLGGIMMEIGKKRKRCADFVPGSTGNDPPQSISRVLKSNTNFNNQYLNEYTSDITVSQLDGKVF